jgi:hypothetical protein
MNIAHYKMKYGELPLEEPFAVTYAEELNDQQRELVINGMDTMAGVLVSVIQSLDEKTEHPNFATIYGGGAAGKKSTEGGGIVLRNDYLKEKKWISHVGMTRK